MRASVTTIAAGAGSSGCSIALEAASPTASSTSAASARSRPSASSQRRSRSRSGPSDVGSAGRRTTSGSPAASRRESTSTATSSGRALPGIAATSRLASVAGVARAVGGGGGEPPEAGVDRLVAALDEAVGVEHERAAVGDRVLAPRGRRLARRADRRREPPVEPARGAVGPDDQRRRVARVGVAQLAAGRVDAQAGERREPAAERVEQAVDALERLAPGRSPPAGRRGPRCAAGPSRTPPSRRARRRRRSRARRVVSSSAIASYQSPPTLASLGAGQVERGQLGAVELRAPTRAAGCAGASPRRGARARRAARSPAASRRPGRAG